MKNELTKAYTARSHSSKNIWFEWVPRDYEGFVLKPYRKEDSESEEHSKKMAPEINAYIDYLIYSLSVVSKQATLADAPLKVSLDLIEKMNFWWVENFVWPTLLHNNKGGLVFHWLADGANLRMELCSDSTYSMRAWDTKNRNTRGFKEIPDESFAEKILPVYYSAILERSSPDWRKFFDKT